MAKAVVMQACAAAFLEEYCDECQMKIGEELEKEGKISETQVQSGIR